VSIDKKEDYLPEVLYSESVDEEGLNTLLSLGEDFSNLHNNNMEFKDYLKSGDDYFLCDEDYSTIIRNNDEVLSSDFSDINDINDEDLDNENTILHERPQTLEINQKSRKISEKSCEKKAKSDIVDRKSEFLLNSKNSSQTSNKTAALKRRKREKGLSGKSCTKAVSSLLPGELNELKSKMIIVRRILEEIIQSNRSSLERDAKNNNSDREKTKKEQSEILFKLKREIFELNLAVHSLQEGGVDQAVVGGMMDEVVHLYTLLREAKDFITGEGEQLINSTTTIRRSRKKARSLVKPAVKASAASASELGWMALPPSLLRLGRVCLYSCVLASALIPVLVYSQARCCDQLNYYDSSWVQFQYSNGPPPI